MGTLSQATSIDRPTSARSVGLAAVWERVISNEWATSALIFVVTRAVALAGAYSGVTQLIQAEPNRDKGWLAELSLNWDAAWYVTLAKNGYTWHPAAEGGTNVAFPPLLPALISALSHVISWLSLGWDWGNSTYSTWIVAGLVITNVSFFAALALLIKLLRPRLGRRGAAFVALALASLPLSLFFSAIYTESLFLLLSLAALLVARSDWPNKWLAASLLAFMASLLKFGGLLLVGVLLVEYLSQRNWSLRKIRFDILWLSIIPTAIVGYMGFLWWRFGTPTAFLDSEYKGWGHQFSLFWGTYWDDAAVRLWKSVTHALPPASDWVLLHGSGNRLFEFLDVFVPPLLLIGAFLARKKLLASEWAWLALGILYPLSSGTSNSLARYMLPLWPGLIWLGTLGERGRLFKVFGFVWIAVSLGLLAWCAAVYGNAKWIG